MLGFGAIGQFAIGEVGAAAGAETITADKWFAALSEPPRKRPGLKASEQQFSALSDPFPFVPIDWLVELVKPASLKRPGLLPGEQQFLAWQPMPSPFVETGWFAPLAEPVRFRRGTTPSRQLFATGDTTVIPTTKIMPWFQALSEPPRFRSGLRAATQQFYAAPAQLRPTPAVSGVLNALETKDTFLGGAQSWNRAANVEIGVVATTQPPSEIGVSVAAPAAITVSISISIV